MVVVVYDVPHLTCPCLALSSPSGPMGAQHRALAANEVPSRPPVPSTSVTVGSHNRVDVTQRALDRPDGFR